MSRRINSASGVGAARAQVTAVTKATVDYEDRFTHSELSSYAVEG